MTHIKVKTVDDGGNGVFLLNKLLVVRVGGGAAEWLVPIDEEFIHTGDKLAYEPHQLDEHIDRVAIRETIVKQISDVNDQWEESFDKIKNALEDLENLEVPEPRL